MITIVGVVALLVIYLEIMMESIMPELQDAFVTIRQDPALARRFSENPTQVLSELQVDTTNLRIRTLGQTRGLDDRGICISVGCIVCVDVGLP